jgi:protein involved in polysaccharide export with SLBB domain
MQGVILLAAVSVTAAVAPPSKGENVRPESAPGYVVEPPDILLIDAGGHEPEGQMVSGTNLVRPDWTIGLGVYGHLSVADMTLAQVKVAIERHLSQYGRAAEIRVELASYSYDSNVYYVITDHVGAGERVYRRRLPGECSFQGLSAATIRAIKGDSTTTGPKTVLDAIASVKGLPAVASKKRIWVARPTRQGRVQVLAVDWRAITQDGLTATNYQLCPGDRVYVCSKPSAGPVGVPPAQAPPSPSRARFQVLWTPSQVSR